MDLKQLSTTEHSQGVLAVLHPVTSQPLTSDKGDPVTITLRGLDDKAVRAVQHQVANKRMSRMAGRSPTRRQTYTAEELEADALEVLVTCTVSWTNVEYQKEQLACTPANVRMLYADLPWLREQVDQFINDRANFLGNC